MCLIKPQFEAGRENVGKNGVVRDPEVHCEVIENIIDFCLENGFSVQGLDYSPVKGPAGNIEYLLYIQKSDEPVSTLKTDANTVVSMSHKKIDKNNGDIQ